jgi:GTPase SAR1 family protein
MITGKVTEYRLAVLGLTNSGKTSFVKRVCYGSFFSEPPSTDEYQDTALFDKTFVYLWDFPQQCINSSNANDIIFGFGGAVYLFDCSDFSKLEESRVYLEDLMKSPVINNLPLLIICSKIDLVQDPTEIKPSLIMKDLMSNLKKTQSIVFSSSNGDGILQFHQWIINAAKPSHMNEIGENQTSSSFVSQTKLRLLG